MQEWPLNGQNGRQPVAVLPRLYRHTVWHELGVPECSERMVRIAGYGDFLPQQQAGGGRRRKARPIRDGAAHRAARRGEARQAF